MNKERFYLFDNIKGLMIFFVVFGHILDFCIEENILARNIYYLIYSFHMPIFVFCTGYFAKFNFKKTMSNIAYPYIIFSVLYTIFKIFVLQKQTISFTTPYHHLWYLFSLFFWYLTLPIIQKRTIKQKIILLIISIFAMLIVGYFSDIDKYLSLARTICFYPFFLFGHICKQINKEIFLKALTNKKTKIITLILFSIMVIIFLSGYFKNYDEHFIYYTMCYKEMNLDIYTRILTLFFNIIGIAFFLSWTPNKNMKLITHFGKSTIYIFLLHEFLTKLIEKSDILKIVDFPILLSVIFALLITIITSSFISQKCFKNFVSYPTKKQET